MNSITNQRIQDPVLGDLFTHEEDGGQVLMSSITQSKSFGSPSLAPAEMDGQELMISLSASTDSMEFDMKGAFDKNENKVCTSFQEPIKEETCRPASPPDLEPSLSMNSAGTKDTSSTGSMTQNTNASRSNYTYPQGYGHQTPYGRPHYPPPPYQNPYYGGHYGGPPPPPHPYQGSQGAPSTYHPYYHGYPPHPGYPPQSSYTHPQSQQLTNGSSNASSQCINQATSFTSSVTSGGSKKRTIDEVNNSDDNDFAIHRGDSSNSVCTSGTVETAPNPISKLICESPIKKELMDPPLSFLDRNHSIESTESSLTFGGLSMTSHSQKQGKKSLFYGKNMFLENQNLMSSLPEKEVFTKAKSLLPSPINVGPVDTGVTPLSKNTRSNQSSAFFFEGDNNTMDQTSTPFQTIGMSASKSSEGSDTSPVFSLDIKAQFSWNLGSDSQGETPVSFGSNVSPGFWAEDGKSPTVQMLASIGTPTSLSDDILRGGNSPISVFFNVPPSEKKREQQEVVQIDHNHFDAIEMPSTPMSSTPMPMQSPYMRGPHTPHGGSSFEHRDNMYAQMNGGARNDGSLPCYQSPRPMYHPANRVVNLRGQDQINAHHGSHNMHLPPHIPSHHHFLASPIGAARNMMVMSSPQPTASAFMVHPSSPHPTDMSKRRCVPLKQPIPTKFQGDMEKYTNASVPEFTALVNFPVHMSQKQSVNLPEGMRCCVMCGQACNCSSAKTKKGSKADLTRKGMSGQYALIPTQNKGLCTQCDVNVWIAAGSNLEIKWCKGCKNFRPWAAFGDKGLATKCVRCRDRQREKYAAQKEEKDKRKAAAKIK